MEIYNLNLSLIKQQVSQKTKMDDDSFQLELSYNRRTKNHVLNIYNSEGEPILLGFLILPYSTLYNQFEAYFTEDEENKLPFGSLIFIIDEGGE